MLRITALYIISLLLLLSINANSLAVESKAEVSANTEKFVLQLKWFHSFQFAGYYAAQEKGFYREAGLDVEIRPRNPDTTVVNDLLEGRAHFGVSDSSLTLRRLNGDPVVALAVIFQNSPLVLMTLEESNISSPLDLAGKRVMYQRDGDDAVITAMFNEFGMSDKDYIYVPQNFNVESLLNNEADAMSAYRSNEPWYYKSRGKKINIINPANYGIDFYGDNLFTTEEMLNNSREKVLAFRHASLRGWHYALKHYDEVYYWLKNKYKGKEFDDYKHFTYEANAIRQVIKPRLVEIGNINPSRFRRIADIYKQKELAPASSNLSGFIYQDYLNKSSFDRWEKPLIIFTSASSLLLLFLTIPYLTLKKKNALREKQIVDSNQAKDTFLTNISHQFRTPLNSIIGFTERLLKSKNKDFDQQTIETLQTIARNSHSLFVLINNFLDLSRIEAGKMQLSISTCNLEEIIDGCYKELTEAAAEKNLNIMLPGEYPVLYLEADNLRLSQIISNIFSNAIKYTPRGGITISVEKEIQSNHEFCKVTIADTGIGIRLEDQKRLNTRFEQSEDQRISTYNTDLGLSLIAEFTHMHGGHITFESTFGIGTSFELHIPVAHITK